jgi:hypothetical protein
MSRTGFLGVILLAVALMLTQPLATVAVPVPQSFQAVVVWGSEASPLVASPGSRDLPLSLTVINLGPAAVYNFTAIFDATPPIIPVSGEGTNLTEFVPILQAGSSVSLIGYYNVQATILPEVVDETVRVSYSNGVAAQSMELGVQVPILGEPQISISAYAYTPTLLYPGYPLASLQVVLANTGNAPATGVNVTLGTSPPVSAAFPGATNRYVGIIPVGTPVPVTFALAILNSSQTQNTTLPLTVTYNGVQSRVFAIPFNENPRAILRVVSVSQPTVSVGDSSDAMTFTFFNSGVAAAEFATITLVPSNVFQPSIPSSASPLLATTYLNSSVGTIQTDGHASATYVVSVSSSVPPGTYLITLLASWRQGGASTPFVQELSVPIQVHQSFSQSFEQSVTNPVVVLLLVLIVVAIVAFAAVVTRERRRKTLQRRDS